VAWFAIDRGPPAAVEWSQEKFAMRRRGFTLLLFAVSIVGSLLAQTPNLPENAVVNAASFVPFGQPGHANAPGSIVSIFGTSLASGVASASTVPLSTSLGGVSVTFNGTPAPLFFVGPSQINAQLPAGLSGNQATIVVSNSAGSSAAKTIQIGSFSPGIFTVAGTGIGQGWVVFANSIEIAAPVGAFEPNFHSHPAKADDILTVFANGLGPVTPPVADGQNTLDGLRQTSTRPVVTVGGVAAPDGNILFSGLAPQFVALYQINFRMPAGVAAGGSVPIQISMGGVTSTDKVTIAAQ
jgi:uncharacterized protein (TIGR03437 family)